jgi:Uma2 family endonuclease
MSSAVPRHLLRLQYEEAVEAYLRSLPPEHFPETTSQATQREISVASFAVLHGRRPDVHYFNELAVQYQLRSSKQIRQVVPDNMVAISPTSLKASLSYDIPLQPVGPFLVLDYPSQGSSRKDYRDSFRKYEQELKVPYCLVFHPDVQELTLFRRSARKYVSVKPNAAGRYPIPQLELEVASLEGWVRFWFRGELLLLPAELQRNLGAARQQAKLAEERAKQAEERAKQAEERAELEQQEKERLLAKLREVGIDPGK